MTWATRTGAVAAVGAAVVAAGALGSGAVLGVAGSAPVTNTAGVTIREGIVVDTRGRAVYTLSGDSRTHPLCVRAGGCWAIWPPVSAASARSLHAARGVHGRLTTWRRGGLLQLLLAGRPLYRYAGDPRPRAANGEGIVSFGGTWHVVRAGTRSEPAPGRPPATTTVSAPASTVGTSPTTSVATSSVTTTTTSCLYPPCY